METYHYAFAKTWKKTNSDKLFRELIVYIDLEKKK